jgi:hypothetical protein
MSRDFLDHVVVTFGPTSFLARFFIEAHEAARALDLLLTLEDDMRALCHLNAAHRSTWYRLPTIFDPEYSELGPGNALWVAARDRAGRPVAAIALRLFDWHGTSLATELNTRRMLYARPDLDAAPAERWHTEIPEAAEMSGDVFYPGALWIEPARRHTGLAPLLCHLSIALAWTTWRPSCAVSFIASKAVKRGVADQYGLRHMRDGVTCRNSPHWGDLDMSLVWLARSEFRDALERIRHHAVFTSSTTETNVAIGSPSTRRQGRMILS